MEFWVLEAKTLSRMARHWKTGAPSSVEKQGGPTPGLDGAAQASPFSRGWPKAAPRLRLASANQPLRPLRPLGAALARPHQACGRPTPGEPIPTELLEKVRAAKTFRAASAMVRQLVFAQTDLAIHSTPFEPKVGAAAETYREVRLQHPAAPCSTLQHTATHRNTHQARLKSHPSCNALQHATCTCTCTCRQISLRISLRTSP